MADQLVAPVAENCCVPPTVTVAVAGDTAPIGATTVTSVVPVNVDPVAVMVTVPP